MPRGNSTSVFCNVVGSELVGAPQGHAFGGHAGRERCFKYWLGLRWHARLARVHGRDARATSYLQVKSAKLLGISAILREVSGILSPSCAKFKQILSQPKQGCAEMKRSCRQLKQSWVELSQSCAEPN
jgi:hypothetical protein